MRVIYDAIRRESGFESIVKSGCSLTVVVSHPSRPRGSWSFGIFCCYCDNRVRRSLIVGPCPRERFGLRR